MILTVILIGTLAGIAGWLAPHPLASATQTNATPDSRKILYYACPMHPDKHYDKPGDCPICGMKLQPVYADATNAPAATTVPPCCGAACSANQDQSL